MRTMKEAIGLLKEEIRSLAAQSREIQARRRLLREQGPATGPERSSLWVEKKMLGQSARYAILAAGLLRERPYRRMERKTENDAPASEYLIWRAVCEALGVVERGKYVSMPQEHGKYIRAWLAVPDAAPAQIAEAAE